MVNRIEKRDTKGRMIAQVEDLTNGVEDRVTIVVPESAQGALESFVAVTELVDAVGQLTIDSGVGQPLSSFQTLLKTYQVLAKAQATLCATAQYLIGLGQSPALGA
jgi:hypothetical protein